MSVDTTGLAVCQASCPFPGGPQPRVCRMRNCCNERCVGCQRGWPYDEQYRHIGPVKAPHSNRWACSRVQWLGVNGAQPCEPGGVEGVLWINASGATVLWQDAAGVLVPWVTGRGAPVLKAAA